MAVSMPEVSKHMKVGRSAQSRLTAYKHLCRAMTCKNVMCRDVIYESALKPYEKITLQHKM
jgi:hypothetical protein